LSGITDKAPARTAAIFPNQQSDPLIGAGRPFSKQVEKQGPEHGQEADKDGRQHLRAS